MIAIFSKASKTPKAATGPSLQSRDEAGTAEGSG